MAGEKHHHKNHEMKKASIQLNNGELWQTDEHLRNSMEAIRKIIQKNSPTANSSLKPEVAATIYHKVNEQIDNIIQNCQLSTAADENLHIILANIIEGIDALVDSSETENMRNATAKIIKALDIYAAHFNHPNWNK